MLALGLIALVCSEIWRGFTRQRVFPAPHISLQYLVFAPNCSQFCHCSFIGNPVFPLTYRLNWPYINNMTDCLNGPHTVNVALGGQLTKLCPEFRGTEEEQYWDHKGR